MNVAPFRARLAATPAALAALLEALGDADARWRPDSGGWSLVEILGHLADEDELDFGRRLKLLLDDPGATWPGIDPERTVAERGHAERGLSEQLSSFASRRAESLAWLAELSELGEEPVYQHPQLGAFTPADLLANWTAHDLLHTRQILTRLWQLTRRDAGDRSLEYAGPAPR